MSNQFLEGFREKLEALEDTDPLQKANFDLLQLVSEAMIGKVSGQEYELRMLEVKTRIAILERQEAKDQQVLPSSFISEENPIKPSEKKAFPVYGEKWHVIQNRLLNAISDLDLNERRLIMFLSPLVRKVVDIDPDQRTFVVRVKDFLAEYGIKSGKYYDELANICGSLTNKSYEFWDFYQNQSIKSRIQVSWFTKAVYQNKQGEVHIDLHNDVVEMLTVFDKENPFTKYERKMIVNLGSYGVILFELILSCMHQQYKQKAYTVEYLRAKFNCVDRYPILTDFKRYVLDKAIDDIETNTPYRISYTQNKKGRVIHEIVFSFQDTREKSLNGKGKNKGLERDPNTADMFTNYTDKQLARAVHSKKFMADYNGLVASQSPVNQSSSAWISHMVEWVKKDPENFTKRPMQEYLDDEQAPRF